MTTCIGCGTIHAKDTPCPDGTVWFTGLVECRICTHRYCAVVPLKPWQSVLDVEDLRCPNCENEACDPVMEDEQ